MSHREMIVEKIKQAMKYAFDQSELFTAAAAEPIAAEYLFTVGVAKKIAELNGPPGDPYVIRVEQDAAAFAKDCLKPIAVGERDGFRRRMIIRRSSPNVSRTGRVDVTVYTDEPNSGYWGFQPVCAIEVKGFDPDKVLVIEDLKRNVCFIRATGDTGDSVLEFTVFAAFCMYKRTSDKWVSAHMKDVKDRYRGYLKEMGDLSDIDSEVIVETVSLEQRGTITEGPDYDEIDTSTKHHLLGVMVVQSRGGKMEESSGHAWESI